MRLPSRRSYVASLIYASAAATLTMACASSGAAPSPRQSGSERLSYGYMIPGERVGAALGMNAGDSIPEIAPRATVPTVVLHAIAQEVATGTWNDGCTRRFGGPTVYAAIFHKTCDAAAGPDADPRVIVGFSATGRVVGRVPWSGPETVTLLVPARRF